MPPRKRAGAADSGRRGNSAVAAPLSYSVPVVAASRAAADERAAEEVAHRFDLRLCEGAHVCEGDHEDLSESLTLVVSASEVRLVSHSHPRSAVVRVDFLAGASGFRARTPGTLRQPIARACGLNKKLRRIVDATAGLCADAAHLAALGASVIALERNPILAALVEDGLRRAKARTAHLKQHWLERLTFHHAEAGDYVAALKGDAAPEVIYLDPMFPQESASGMSKKEMELTRSIVGDDADAGELLAVARGIAAHRVVVKRPAKSQPLGEAPTFQVPGKAIRYDIYVAAGSSSA